jgi:hypothetical protein
MKKHTTAALRLFGLLMEFDIRGSIDVLFSSSDINLAYVFMSV